jgi:predicted component of type VI protein secretion system
MVKPISKWLKNGMEVFIGRSAKCYVFIKWNDEHVEDKHAMLVLENGRVHIIALYETLLNGVIIPENQKVELNNDDIIQLGRYSNSKMQYKER